MSCWVFFFLLLPRSAITLAIASFWAFLSSLVRVLGVECFNLNEERLMSSSFCPSWEPTSFPVSRFKTLRIKVK